MSNGLRRLILVASVGLVGLAGCSSDNTVNPAGSADPSSLSGDLNVEIVDRIPHDPNAFTQGLFFDDDGRLFEGTGLEGESSIREVDPTDGSVLREEFLPAEVFGEGATIGPNGIVQLTWTSGIAYTWNADTFEAGTPYDYSGEGWGLAFDGQDFWQSDGSGTLTRRDGETFAVVSTREVTRDGNATDELNELEWVDGLIFANVWHSDEILAIDPGTGEVTGVIDASALYNDDERTTEMTLNGIAHRPGDPVNRLWLTGKNWPEIFVVDVVNS